jgi:hypothetical protein
MGKYLKLIETEDFSLRNLNHHKDQPNNGPTVLCFKNKKNKNKTSFLNNQNKQYKTTDKITNFTWRFVYYEGSYPYVIIKFTAINPNLLNTNAIITLETNTCTKKRRNVSLNVFDRETDYAATNKRNITWKFLDDIVLNQEFILYVNGRINKRGPWRSAFFHNQYRGIPDDWKIKINIRPSIRFADTTIRPYSNYRGLSEYREVEYFLKDEIKLQ